MQPRKGKDFLEEKNNGKRKLPERTKTQSYLKQDGFKKQQFH